MADRSFGRTVAGGLVTAGATAYAGTRAWAEADGATTGTPTLPAGFEAADAPAVTALALVVLAAWGVLLVTRGRVRRGIALLGAAAAVGTLVVAVMTAAGAQDSLAESLRGTLGATGPDVRWTVWPWVAVVAALGSAALSAYAVRACGGWPEMGRRYDAPAATRADDLPEDLAEADEQAIWKALDEGRDPTQRGRGTD